MTRGRWCASLSQSNCEDNHVPVISTDFRASDNTLTQPIFSFCIRPSLVVVAPYYGLTAICTPHCHLLYRAINQSTELNHYLPPHHGSSSDVNSWVLMYCQIYIFQQHASTQRASPTHKLRFNVMKPSSLWLGNPSPKSHKSLSHETRG